MLVKSEKACSLELEICRSPRASRW